VILAWAAMSTENGGRITALKDVKLFWFEGVLKRAPSSFLKLNKK